MTTTKKEKTIRTHIFLTEKQLTALDRLAIELYSDRSKLIRRAVDMLIQREERDGSKNFDNEK